MFMQMVFAEGEAAAANAVQGPMAIIANLAPIIILFAVFYFMIIRPQKKRDKQTKDMIASLKVGDKIVTIGGVVGKILRIKDECVVIESTNDGTKMEFQKWAIKEVTTIKDA